MKRFQFSLEAVREVRQSEEQAAQRALADSLLAREEVALRLVRLEGELKQAWQGLSTGALRGNLAEHIQHAHSWCVLLEERKNKLNAELTACRRKVAANQQILKIAMQRREALDRLRSKQRETHEREEQHQNQQNLDEIATRRAWRTGVQRQTV